MKTDKVTKLLLLMIVILLSFIVLHQIFSPTGAYVSSGSFGNIKFLGSYSGFSILLDTKTGEVWELNFSSCPNLKWTKCGSFIGYEEK